jgi:hypothetical protein
LGESSTIGFAKPDCGGARNARKATTVANCRIPGRTEVLGVVFMGLLSFRLSTGPEEG